MIGQLDRIIDKKEKNVLFFKLVTLIEQIMILILQVTEVRRYESS